MTPDDAQPVTGADAPAPVAPFEPPVAPTFEQVSTRDLAELRQRADKYRFLFKTIVTVTAILVGATLIVVLASIFTDT